MQITVSDTMLVTVTGIAIVFVVLLALVLLMVLFGKVASSGSGRKESTLQVVSVPDGLATQEDPDEILAVIAAAVVAFSEATGKQYAVRSVRPASGRSAWAAAGVYENTRPF